MIATVLLPNAIAMILLLVLLCSANSVSRHSLMLDSKIFEMMIVCNFLQCAGEIIAYSIEGVVLPGFHALNLIVNAILFIVNIFFAFLWVIYSEYKIFEDMARAKKKGKRLVIPALIIMACSVLNLFVPIFFRVTPDNDYQRTELYLIPYLVTYFYLAYGTIFIYRHKSQARKYVFLPALVFMFPILLGSGVQFFFYGVSTVWVGVAIALVAVYVNVQNEISYTDALSGLYTRIYLFQYLENALRKKELQKSVAGIMLDIDSFKKINDTYGHLTGDDAIRTAGKILRNPMVNCTIAARYGGDEFVLIKEIQNEDEVIELIDQITKVKSGYNEIPGRKYQLHFSLGYSILDPTTDTVDSFIERMDRAMYEMKKIHKQSAEVES